MGMTPKEAEEAVPGIIEFADIGEAAYRPVRTYSSGMHARLRFAIAAAVHPKILLVDEALGTGDAIFRKKSDDAIQSILDDAGTMFMVNHNMDAVTSMCNRAIWIHKGEMIADGEAKDIAKLYTDWTRLRTQGKNNAAQKYIEECKDSYVPLYIRAEKRRNRPKHFSG